MRVRLIAIGVLAALIAARALAVQSVAYCSLPPGPPNQAWGFHAGAPIHGSRGVYIHGRGTVAGRTAGGLVCQVIRAPGAADRQLILTPTHTPVSIRPGIHVQGVLGNQMSLQLRVSSSTDRICRVGTRGTLTLFASYNGPRHDTIRLALSKPCHRDSHSYSGPGVIVLVPR